jgi:hypothetical protein
MAVLITNGAFGCGLHFARLPGICNSRYIEKLELKKRSTAVGWVGGVVAGFIVWTREMTSVLHSFIFWLAISRKNEIASFLKFLPSFREREEKSRECLDSIYQSQLERIALFMSCESANAADWKCMRLGLAAGPLSRFESDGRNWNDIFPVSQCSAIPDFHLISANSVWTMFVCLFSFSWFYLDLILFSRCISSWCGNVAWVIESSAIRRLSKRKGRKFFLFYLV